MSEPWLQEQLRQKRYEDWARTRPVCLDCGEWITGKLAVRLNEGMICTDCVSHRLVEVEPL